jgi:hypothetical protein
LGLLELRSVGSSWVNLQSHQGRRHRVLLWGFDSHHGFVSVILDCCAKDASPSLFAGNLRCLFVRSRLPKDDRHHEHQGGPGCSLDFDLDTAINHHGPDGAVNASPSRQNHLPEGGSVTDVIEVSAGDDPEVGLDPCVITASNFGLGGTEDGSIVDRCFLGTVAVGCFGCST